MPVPIRPLSQADYESNSFYDHMPMVIDPDLPEFSVQEAIRKWRHLIDVDSLPYYKKDALYNLANCKSPRMGYHTVSCDKCGTTFYAPNSCGKYYCNLCQSVGQSKWVAERQKDVLNTPYFHVVFTVPEDLYQFYLQDPKTFCDILFRSSSQTVMELAADEKYLEAAQKPTCP